MLLAGAFCFYRRLMLQAWEEYGVMDRSRQIESRPRKVVSKGKYYLIYTLLFSITAVLVYSAFIINRNSFIWSSDGFRQHYMALSYLGRWGRQILKTLLKEHTISVPMWDVNIGYGSDILTTLQFYGFGNPFYITSVLVPMRYTEYLYNVLTIVYLYFAGISFSVYCFRMKKHPDAVLAGAIGYVFCGYVIFVSIRHPFFLLMLLYLPLLLTGAEKVLHLENPALFIFMVFICGISNFYLFYMLVAGVVLYVFIRVFIGKEVPGWKKKILTLLRFTLYGFLGVMMAGVILLPVIYVFLTAARVENPPAHFPLYDLNYYKKLITSFLSIDSAGSFTYLGFSAPALLAVILLFAKKGYRELKAGIAVTTLMLCIPFAGRVMNGFAYVSNRWCGLYAFIIAYILVTIWPCFFELDRRKIIYLSACTGIYYLVLILLRAGKNTFANAGLLFAALFAAAAVSTGHKERNAYSRRIGGFFLTALVVISSSLNAYYFYAPEEGNNVSNHIDTGRAYEAAMSKDAGTIAKAVVPENGVYDRYEGSMAWNDNAFVGIPGISFYWSLANGLISQFQQEVLFHASSFKTSIDYYGNNRRTFLNALSGVRYLVHKGAETKFLPYGYTKQGTYYATGKRKKAFVKKYKSELNTKKLSEAERKQVHDNFPRYTVYENAYPLSYGYTYDSFFTRESYEEMTPAQRQEALLQGVLVEKEDSDKINDTMPQIAPEFSGRELPYTADHDSRIVDLAENSYLVTKDHATLTLKFEKVPDSETYFAVSGLNVDAMTQLELYLDDDAVNFPKTVYDDALTVYERNQVLRKNREDNSWSDENNRYQIYIKTDHSSVLLSDKSERFEYYEGEEDFLINLGYMEEGTDTITVDFPTAGIYSFKQMQVIAQPMEGYEQRIQKLSEDHPSVRFDTNTILSDVTLKEDKLLCLAFPYDKGWSAVIDGKETPIMRVNTMFMGFPLKAGTHSIVLRYRTWGLRDGILITLAGFAVFVVLLVIWNRKKGKRVGQNG